MSDFECNRMVKYSIITHKIMDYTKRFLANTGAEDSAGCSNKSVYLMPK
jgi:hypothetical protein